MSQVTLLIAVYNAEATLPKCLDSALAQTLSDVQIICIDDASTDRSLDVVRQYAARDQRIVVVERRQNGGAAAARNDGLKQAAGQYVAMLDADDWLAPDALQQAVATMEAHPLTDCVLFDVQYVWPDGHTSAYDWRFPHREVPACVDGSFRVMTGRQAFLASLSWQIHGVYMARRQLYERCPYDASLRIYSDDNTTRLHYLLSREVRSCPGRYFYRQHEASQTGKVSTDHMMWMGAMTSLRSQLEALRESDDVLRRVEWERWKVIVGCYWYLFVHRRQFSDEEVACCLRMIKKEWALTKGLRLKGSPTWKLGWKPWLGHWRLFRMEEWLYFHLRRLLRSRH